MKKKYIYLCGPTVYNKVHIGNMRPIVTFDLMLRGMKKIDPNIKLIHNITDIDDKIVREAQKQNVDEAFISQKYFEFYQDMLSTYNIQTIDEMPLVTESIEIIEDLIQKMINNGYAYESNGSIYFETLKLEGYGQVSNNKLDKLTSDEEPSIDKKNALDFALWKNKQEGKNWNVTFGSGRPGWHTECAAFIDHFGKGESLEIHGGGIDLKFPHHENENAQFLAINNKPIAKKWIHVGVINFDNQKMSKSIGNIVLADSFLDQFENKELGADVFRLLILSSNYRSIIELNNELIKSLETKLDKVIKIVNKLFLESNNKPLAGAQTEIVWLYEELSNLNFSNVMKNINDLMKKYNETKDLSFASQLFYIFDFLGFWFTKNTISQTTMQIYKDWQELVKAKDFAKADELREVLINKKII